MRACALWIPVAASLQLLGGCGKPPPEPDAGEPDAGQPDAGEFIPTTNAEHQQMLEGLGFATDVGPRLDPIGRPVTSGHHPLGKRFSVFHPRGELYIAGLTSEAHRDHLIDDSAQGWAELPVRQQGRHGLGRRQSQERSRW